MTSAGVAITGTGSISPLSVDSSGMWSGLCEGRCGIGRIKSFDASGFSCQLAGEVPDFKVRKYVPRRARKSVKLMCRDIELAVVASFEALNDSGLVTRGIDEEHPNVEPTRMSINLGAGLISCDLEEIAPAVAKSVTDGKFDIQKWGREGLEDLTPLWLLKYLPNMLACHICIIHDIQGPSNTITCAEAGGLLAIGESAQLIFRGDSDISLAGGAEAKVNPIVMTRQCLLKRATDKHNDDPAGACRPFDAQASGSVFGEGAGMVVLEDIQRARERGSKIYAEIAGVGQSQTINSAYEHLEPTGEGVQTAIEKAMEDARIKPEDLDLIIPHGTGIPEDDLAEAGGIEAALGDAVGRIPVFPTKSMLSTTGAASGALDVIAAVCAMRDGKIPAARNLKNRADGCNLNIITKPIEKDLDYVLCCNYTYGGQTAAVILKKAEK